MTYKRLPSQVIVAAFPAADGAEKCLRAYAKAFSEIEGMPIPTNAAIVNRNAEGTKTKVKELGKPNAINGFLAGGVVGAAAASQAVGGGALGALCGVVTAPLSAVGGSIGGAVARFTVEGMDKNKLEELKGALTPNSSALVLVLAETIVDKKSVEAKEYKAVTDEFVVKISENIERNLKAGSVCAQSLAVGEDGIAGMKLVVGDDVFSLKTMVLTEDAVAAAEFAATPEGAAAQAVVATEDAIFADGAVVTATDAVEYELDAVAE